MCINKSGVELTVAETKNTLRGVAPNLAARNRRARAEDHKEQFSNLEWNFDMGAFYHPDQNHTFTGEKKKKSSSSSKKENGNKASGRPLESNKITGPLNNEIKAQRRTFNWKEQRDVESFIHLNNLLVAPESSTNFLDSFFLFVTGTNVLSGWPFPELVHMVACPSTEIPAACESK